MNHKIEQLCSAYLSKLCLSFLVTVQPSIEGLTRSTERNEKSFQWISMYWTKYLCGDVIAHGRGRKYGFRNVELNHDGSV